MGKNHFAALPVALYGVVFLLASVAYFILVRVLIALHGRDSVLAAALGRDFKGKILLAIYASVVPVAFLNSWISFGLYIIVAIIWLVPDRRIEKNLVQ